MTLILLSTALWLGLGVVSDRVVASQTRKDGEEYSGPMQLACYLVGPIALPIALLWALIKRITYK